MSARRRTDGAGGPRSENEKVCPSLSASALLVVLLGAMAGVGLGAMLISNIPFFLPGKRGWSTVVVGTVYAFLAVAGATTGYFIWSRRSVVKTTPAEASGENGDKSQ